jgi:hypothetical protein
MPSAHRPAMASVLARVKYSMGGGVLRALSVAV